MAVRPAFWIDLQPTKEKKRNITPSKIFNFVKVGDHLFFGNYMQGENDEIEPIEWRVLEVEDGKALVISEKLLDCVKYNETNENVTWETSTLRKWMNNDFLNAAFNENEKKLILSVSNENPDNQEYKIKGGKTTTDQIFALNMYEAEKYFESIDYSINPYAVINPDLMAAVTPYAKKHCSLESQYYVYSISSGEKTGSWWLRSPGIDSESATYVLDYGSITEAGTQIDFDFLFVRPALWIKLSE